MISTDELFVVPQEITFVALHFWYCMTKILHGIGELHIECESEDVLEVVILLNAS